MTLADTAIIPAMDGIKRTLIDAPAPGLHPDIPNDEYRAWQAAANSDLTMIEQFSPMHMRYRRENPPEPTPALLFGSAVHCAILEPEKFKDQYVVAQPCSAFKRDGCRCSNGGIIYSAGKWLCGVHGKDATVNLDRVILSIDQAEAISNIARAVSFHDSANGALKSEGPNELSAVFNHEENGQLCKLRADGYRPEWEMIIDIKTTENASRSQFEKSIAEFGYHRQAAFYIDGLRSLGVNVKHFAFICVEKKAPYGVATYRLGDTDIDAGRDEIRRLIRIYKNCRDKELMLIKQGGSGASAWYGYESQFQDISLPGWKIRQLMNRQD